VNTGAEQVNAAAANFSYPEQLLEAVQIDTAGSILGILAPDNAAGVGAVRFSGGKIPPPFSGVQKLFSVTFRARNIPGTASFVFQPDSAVLIHGTSANILNIAASGGATIEIVAGSSPTISPSPTGSPSPTTSVSPSPTPSPTLSISDIRAEKNAAGHVMLSWKTSEATRGEVYYGRLEDDEFPFFILDGMSTREHSFLLENISNPQGYAVKIVGVDASGNRVSSDRLILSEILKGKTQDSGENVTDEGGEGFTTLLSTPFFIAGALAFTLLGGLVVFLIARRRNSS